MGASGGSGKVDVPEGVNKLEAITKRLFQESQGVRKESLSQVEEALKTGGVGARIPIIQRAVEAANASSSQAQTGTEESLARVGLTGTPYGQRILAGQKQQGAFAASQIPTDYVQQLIQQAPAIGLNYAQAGIGAANAGARLRIEQEEFNGLQFKAFMQDLKSSLQSTGGSAGGGYGG